MSTSLTLQTTISNPNLPQSHTFVRDGLVAAHRAYNQNENLLQKDLSGNGNTLIKVGAPVMISGAGVEVDGSNGYRSPVTALATSTLIVIAKPKPTGASGLTTHFLTGDFNDDTTDAEWGDVLFLQLDQTSDFFRIRSSNPVDDAAGATVGGSNKDFHVIKELPFASSTNAYMIALSLNATTNIRKTYIPGIDGATPTTQTDFSTNNGLADRKLTDAAGDPWNYSIGSVSDAAWINSSLPSFNYEFLLYNRELSGEEIFQNYTDSKAFWAQYSLTVN